MPGSASHSPGVVWDGSAGGDPTIQPPLPQASGIQQRESSQRG
jgi:hypothetical protein